MRLLVVTPTLGSSPWLAETVASVASLSLVRRHVLVAPAAVVDALRARFPTTTVLAEPGGGMYAAINAGLMACSDWDAFTYINDDDLLLSPVDAVVAAVTAQPRKARFGYGQVRLINERGRRIGVIPVSPWPALNRALYAQRLEPVYQHGTVVNRTAWEQVGGFDSTFQYCGDSEFLARLCVREIPAFRVPGEVAAFRLRPGQLTRNRPAMLAERDRVDQKLALRADRRSARQLWARLVFRTWNVPAYAGRIARHGFVSFDELIVRGG